jgi:hypothetical protein
MAGANKIKIVGGSEYEATQLERDEKKWWKGTRHSPRLPLQPEYRFDLASKTYKLTLPAIYAPTGNATVDWGFGSQQLEGPDDPILVTETLEELETIPTRDNKSGSGFSIQNVKTLRRDSKRYRKLMLSLRVKRKQLKRAEQTAAVIRQIRSIERKALQLYGHDVRGMTAQEISDALGGTRAAVSNAIDRLDQKVQAEIETGEFFDEVMQDLGEMQQQIARQQPEHDAIFGKRGLPADGHVSRCACGSCLRGEPNFKIDAVSVGRGWVDTLGDITPRQAWRERRASHPKEVSAGIVPQGFKPLRPSRHLVGDDVLNERAQARKVRKTIRGDAVTRIRAERKRKAV